MKKTAEEVLAQMIGLFTDYLEELQEVTEGEAQNEFAYGEKTAYVECLEYISEWEGAAKYGLDFEVEKRLSL